MKAASRNILRTLSAVALVAVFAAFTTAEGQQSRDLRVVSARAGGVNYVFGDVKYHAPGKQQWKALDSTVELDNGDVVRTGATGLAEVLLNPGSYLRLGTDSEFEMFDTSLDELQVRLTRGSAVVEATGYDKFDLAIKVTTPQGLVTIVKTGIYRINVLPTGMTEVVVQKGRALVGGNEWASLVVKKGSVARVAAGGGVAIAKADKKTRDALDSWSKERGEELASANRNITRRQANTLLASLGGSARYPFGSNGVWYFDPRRNCYTFVPFMMGWQSPYGGYYDTMIWGQPTACGSCPNGYGGAGVYRGGSNGTPGSSASSGTYTGGGNSSGGTTPAPTITPGPAPAPMPAPTRTLERSSPIRGKMSPDIDPR